MQMEMENCLAGIGADIVNRAEAMFQVAFAGNFRRYNLAIANQLRIRFSGHVNAWNMFLWDDQHMRGRLRINVLKSKRFLVFVNFFGWNPGGNNLAKKAVSHNSGMLSNVRMLEFFQGSIVNVLHVA